MIKKDHGLAAPQGMNYLQFRTSFSVQIVSLLFLCLCIGCQDSNSSNYRTEEPHSSNRDARESLIINDNERSFDAAITLSPEELKLEQSLFDLRHQYDSIIQRNNLPFYNKPFHDIKSFIDTTVLYNVFKSMPKGGLLHAHSGGITDINWLIDEAKAMPECYVFTNPDNGTYIFGQLGVFKEGTAPLGFISLKEKIKSDPNFETVLYDLLVLKKEALSPDLDYWSEFEKRFMRIGALISYRPFFKSYYKKSFSDLLKDNIKHLEIRYIFGGLYDFENEEYSNETIISDLNEVLAEIHEIEPDFTLSLIYTSFKFLSEQDINNALKEAFRLKKIYPDLIRGFDLVAEEDRGNPIAFYDSNWESLEALNAELDMDLALYLHAGESNSNKNTNVYDAVLLDSKRIGHGLNLVFYPELIKTVIEKDILIEISPISNQLLGYVPDLRTHPGRLLLKNGVQAAISSDDPSVFGYQGVTYDFWMVFVAWELDLKAVKKLVFNSIKYASLNELMKQKALQTLEKDWKHFVSTTNAMFASYER